MLKQVCAGSGCMGLCLCRGVSPGGCGCSPSRLSCLDEEEEELDQCRLDDYGHDTAERLRQVFRSVDANGDGRLSAAEIAACFKAVGIKWELAMSRSSKLVSTFSVSSSGEAELSRQLPSAISEVSVSAPAGGRTSASAHPPTSGSPMTPSAAAFAAAALLRRERVSCAALPGGALRRVRPCACACTGAIFQPIWRAGAATGEGQREGQCSATPHPALFAACAPGRTPRDLRTLCRCLCRASAQTDAPCTTHMCVLPIP